MERKLITDEMLLEPFLKQLEKKFPLGEFVAKFLMFNWLLAVPMFIWMFGVPMALLDCLMIAAVYFGFYKPRKKKRLSYLVQYREIARAEDLLVRLDAVSRKEAVEEFIGYSYYISFRDTSGYRLPVTQQQYQSIQEGDPIYTAILRSDRLSKYRLKKPFRPLWWHGHYWYRPGIE